MQAAKHGYTNILLYEEGMPVWEESGFPVVKGPNYEERVATERISAQALKTLLDSAPETVTVIDVRDAHEYTEGHIPGAQHIPVASFAQRSSGLDKQQTIVVYCNAGGRSAMAYRKLVKLGYAKRYQALLPDWKAAGYPLTR